MIGAGFFEGRLECRTVKRRKRRAPGERSSPAALNTEDRPHSGVIFGDEKTLKPDNPSAMAASLAALAKEIGNADTSNMIRFLRRVRI